MADKYRAALYLLKKYWHFPGNMVFYKSSREHFGGLAQLGERLPCKQEVTSSNLVFSTVLTLHLENDVLSVACRHAIKQNILKLMEASFQRIKYLFCNVPWKPHIRNRRSKYLDQDIRGNCYNRKLCNGYTLWRKQSKKLAEDQRV